MLSSNCAYCLAPLEPTPFVSNCAIECHSCACQKCATALNEEQEVEELLNRVSEGGIADDRREALGQLRDLALDNPQVCARNHL